MSTLKLLVDGQSFDAKIKNAATSDEIEKAANEFGENLSRLSHITIELTDGSFLVLGEKMLERTLFVFTRHLG